MPSKHYIYETASGRLVSIGKLPPGQLKQGLASKEIDDTLSEGKLWDEATQDFVAPPGRRILPITEVFARFTELELKEMLGLPENNSHKDIRALSRYVRLTPVIDLDGPIINDGLAQLVTLNILTNERVAEILSDG